MTSMLCLCTVALLAQPTDLQRLVPPDTPLLITIGARHALDHWRDLDLVQLFFEDEMQEFLAPALDALYAHANWHEFQAVVATLATFGLPELLAGDASLALLGFGQKTEAGYQWSRPGQPPVIGEPPLRDEDGCPDLLISIATRDRPSAERALAKLLEFNGNSSVPHAQDADIQVWADAGLHYAFVDTTLLAATRYSTLVDAMALAAADDPAPSLADATAFARFRELAVRGDELLSVFAAPPQLLELAIAADPEQPAWLGSLRTAGLDAIAGLGVVSALGDGRLRESWTVTWSEPASGLLTLGDALRADALPDGDSALGAELPTGASTALALQCDTARLFDWVVMLLGVTAPDAAQELLADVDALSADLGIELRQELLGPTRLSACLPPVAAGTLLPEITGAVRPPDLAKFQQLLTTLLPALGIEARPLALKDGLEGTSLTLPDLPFTPTFAAVDGSLLVSSAPNVLKTSLARRARQTPLLEAADFQRCLTATTGGQLADVAAFFYVDLAAHWQQWAGTVEMLLPGALAEAPFPLDAALFPAPETVTSHLSGILTTLRAGEGYLALDSCSPLFSVQSMIDLLFISLAARGALEQFEAKAATATPR